MALSWSIVDKMELELETVFLRAKLGNFSIGEEQFVPDTEE